MSVIFVLVGQCGNQVGSAVVRTLAENCRSTTAPSPPQQHNFTGPFFSSDGFARAVLVDAEPKVVEAVTAANPGLFRPSNLVTGRSGRGNSWSLGYCGLPETDEAEVQAGAFRVSTARDQLERDRSVLCRALKAVHAETRRCDDGMVEAIVVLHSLAGGTGSGLGCALVENIRFHFCCDGAEHDKQKGGSDDDGDHGGEEQDPLSFGAPFGSSKAAKSRQQQQQQRRGGSASANGSSKRPRPPSILDEDTIREGVFGEPRRARFVCSVCVAPLVQGELAVQSINACLTLRTLVRHCDAVFLLRNDCHKLFRGLEHTHGAASSGGSASSSSFMAINNFFASMLVSALQGGRVFGCVAELLEASVARVAEIDWAAAAADTSLAGGGARGAQKQQSGGRFEWSEFSAPSSKEPRRPRAGPRLLTLVPWDPRAPWAASFRRSSVTATLCGRDTSRADVGELLCAYLCNEVKDMLLREGGAAAAGGENKSAEIASSQLLCSVLDRGFTETASIAAALDGKSSKSLARGRLPPAGGASSTPAAGSVSAAATKPVLVLNQSSELCTSILMPFFRDAAAKVESGAYMHTFNVRGILEAVFSSSSPSSRTTATQQQQQAKKSRAPALPQYSFSPPAGRRFSPRRSSASDGGRAEFARKFVNQALVDLLEYLGSAFPM
jgi:hypothetical protein